jgi:radical SAM protein with 4Fe4S-binding SPASM domain
MLESGTHLMKLLRYLERSYPSMVQIFTVDYICNSKCKYCPVGRYNAGDISDDSRVGREARRTGFFSMDLFRKIARETGNHPSTILRLHGRGEPLMHPGIVEMVRTAKECGVGTVTTFTNGILMSPSTARSLLEAGLDVIEVSIDAFTDHTYRRIRRTSYFDTVVRNTLSMIELRDNLEKETRIMVSAVNHPEFLPEREIFEDYWGERADQVLIRRRTTFNDRVPYSDWKNRRSSEPLPCPQPWTRFNVSPTGKVLICSNDWGDEVILGDLNLKDESIYSIWVSEEYRRIRQSHLSGEEMAYCRNCTEDDGKRWSDSYEKIMARLDSESQDRTRHQGG